MNTTRELLEALQDYVQRYPQEKEVAQRIALFITDHEDWTSRDNPTGHVTASVWITDEAHSKVLLAYHRKLDRWVQLGGHVEAGESLIEAALREAFEESGLTTLRLIERRIYDLDIHTFPAHGQVPGHLHFDVRFLLQADGAEQPVISAESRQVAWIERRRITEYTDEYSVLRMAEKL